MALNPLTTYQEVEARLGRTLTPDEQTRVDTLIIDASAAVRLVTGQDFDEATTTKRLKVKRRKVRLPQRPVTAVSAVIDINANPVLFTWLGDDSVQVGRNVPDDFGWNPWRTDVSVVDVTYTHGYAATPDVVVAVVCGIVLRAFGTNPTATGVQQESIGGYSYSIGAAAAAGGVGMLPAEREALRPFGPRAGRWAQT